MHLLSTLLFAVSGNLDNLAVGLSYGLRQVRIGWRSNLLIGAITCCGTAAAMVLGKSALLFLPERLAGVLGSLFIAGLGAWGLLRGQLQGEPGPREAPPELSLRQAALLGLALMANNAALGVGASITGLRPLPTALCSLSASVLLLYGGNRLGASRLAELAGRNAGAAANWLMVALGVYELFH